MIDQLFKLIPEDVITETGVPEKFTFPFFYEPHPLARHAAEELQDYLTNQKDFEHNFGLVAGKEGAVIGKMFGVLVVKNDHGQLGYLSAFSGKLAGGNHHKGFIRPIFDMLDENGFFRTGERELTAINHEVEALETDPRFLQTKKTFLDLKQEVANQLKVGKEKLRTTKADRRARRLKGKSDMDETEFAALTEVLRLESIHGKFAFRDLDLKLSEDLKNAQQELDVFLTEINQLKTIRKKKSNILQNWLFDQYNFLNIKGELKNVRKVFELEADRFPPAGSGECAAPKLLHYAFQNNLEPICMAEFWWGASLKKEIRKPRHYYPACRSKCEPILGHMLQGMNVDENPLLKNPALGKQVAIIYEDEDIVAINKPAEFLSVPGKIIKDSVQNRMKQRFPKATGPLIVHRLDMSTSGLMLIAKHADAHRFLQRQFINRKVKKRYIALLDGIIKEEEGTIDLPLRVDLDNRPHQMVCYEHGKKAKTNWKLIKRKANKSLIHFFPISGRTHQLRVHASHPSGLNIPILGDDLYGTWDKRLHLHAEWIKFIHPRTREEMELTCPCEFNID